MLRDPPQTHLPPPPTNNIPLPATVGNYLGTAAFKSRLLKREHIAKTEEFYDKYGGKTGEPRRRAASRDTGARPRPGLRPLPLRGLCTGGVPGACEGVRMEGGGPGTCG